jgi:hypothetical protein
MRCVVDCNEASQITGFRSNTIVASLQVQILLDDLLATWPASALNQSLNAESYPDLKFRN